MVGSQVHIFARRTTVELPSQYVAVGLSSRMAATFRCLVRLDHYRGSSTAQRVTAVDTKDKLPSGGSAGRNHASFLGQYTGWPERCIHRSVNDRGIFVN